MNRKLTSSISLLGVGLAAVWLAKAGATPTVTFEIDPPNPVAGQSILLRDTSPSAAASWLWTFGDGGSATSASPSHVWAGAGAYTVQLSAQGTTVEQSVNVTSATTLRMLASHPFDVAIAAKDPKTGADSPGRAVSVTDRFGWFSFPGITQDAGNPEVTVKLLEAPTFGHYWIFWSAMTSLPYTMTVTDVTTGQVQVYEKTGSDPSGGWDLTSFPWVTPAPTVPAAPTETPVPGQPTSTRTKTPTPTATATGAPAATPTPAPTPGITQITLRAQSWQWNWCFAADQSIHPCVAGACAYEIEQTSVVGQPPNTFTCHKCVIHLHEGCSYNLTLYNGDPPDGEPSSAHAVSDNPAIGLPATTVSPGQQFTYLLTIPPGAPEQDFHCTNDSCAQGGPPETTHELMLGKILIDP